MNKQAAIIELNRQKQAVLDVLNSLEVVDADEGYILVESTVENIQKLNAVGVTDEEIHEAGDDDTFCILAVAFNGRYADGYNGKLVLWGPIDDDLRSRVIEGQGTPEDAERLLRSLEPELYGLQEAIA